MPVCARMLCWTMTRKMESSDRKKITASTTAKMNNRSSHLKMNFITIRFSIYDIRFTRRIQVANELINRKSQIVNSNRHIFRPHFQAFILVLPNHGSVGIEQFRRELAAREREQLFRLLRRVLEGVVVISHASALAVVPMRDGVDRLVLLRPGRERIAQFGGDFIERHEDFVAMLADEALGAHVAREQRQERRAAARRFRVGGGRGGEALVPHLAVVPDFGGEAIRADERMREPPCAAFELAERR